MYEANQQQRFPTYESDAEMQLLLLSLDVNRQQFIESAPCDNTFTSDKSYEIYLSYRIFHGALLESDGEFALNVFLDHSFARTFGLHL